MRRFSNRTNFLVPGPSDATQTRIDRGVLNARAGRRQAEGRVNTGPMRCVEIPFQLVPNVPVILSEENLNRAGLMLQNKDPTNNLFFSFGSNLADGNSSFLGPLGTTVLLDFVCPVDRVSVFATVAISGHFRAFGRAAE